MSEGCDLLEREVTLTSRHAAPTAIIVRGRGGLLRVAVADAALLRDRERHRDSPDARESVDPSEPFAQSLLPDYHPPSKALRLLPLPTSAPLNEEAADWCSTASSVAAGTALGLEIFAVGGLGQAIGRVSAIEAAFWLNVGDGVIVPFMGGLEIALDRSLDRSEMNPGAPLLTCDGDLVGVTIAVGDEIAIAAPAEQLLRENDLVLARRADIREHNAHVAQSRSDEMLPFGNVIRQFGVRMAFNPAFYSRAVGA